MADDMVMRSVYLRPNEDTELKRLAHTFDFTKSDLIRAAISLKLAEWRMDNSGEAFLRDVEAGLRDVARRDRSPTIVEPAKLKGFKPVVKPTRTSTRKPKPKTAAAS